MHLYELCFDYLELLNLLSKPKLANHLHLKECMERHVFIQGEVAKRLAVDPNRLKIILYNLDILIDFNPPLKSHDKIETYAHDLDHSLSDKAVQNFLLNKTHEIKRKGRTIKDDVKWRF